MTRRNPNPPEDGDILSVGEYSRHANWSNRTTYNMVRSGRLVAFKDAGGCWKIPWQGRDLDRPAGYLTLQEKAKQEGVTPMTIRNRLKRIPNYGLMVNGKWYFYDSKLYTEPR